MNDGLFQQLETAARSQGPAAVFDLLLHDALSNKNYARYFEIRLMQKRHELGLPLIHSGTIADLPAGHQVPYQAFVSQVARETGKLFLDDGNIVRAWPYFRAVGDPAPVAAAIDAAQSVEDLDAVLGIALQEGVNPRKGFTLFLQSRGTCQAIDYAIQYPDPANRIEFLTVLVRTLYTELAEHLKEAIAREEGKAPDTNDVADLIAGRDWLFEGGGYYVENSHLGSILQASPQFEDPETLRLTSQMAEYACHLAPLFQFPGTAPFDDLYVDHAHYLRAVTGRDVDAAVAHFENKVKTSVPGSAEVLVGLLARVKRYQAAIQASLEHLNGEARNGCPSAVQLCQMAGDYESLRRLARDRGDLLAFTAGVLER
jgi:pimeloyl-ACP methyl ester carboxylesterase